ncbi:DUF3275 family protein [Pseudomonas asiatica]|uniref:DUF3275 family protein n=1 Tax=Pseudomonas asiatica TaxID=2219225 RepID=A0ABU5KX48_9PSED|nr:DUF3275 family protein [Pseudomonas asiatica]MDZ5738072.1 DUF3275 family protein [Pseudomonas asiatica]MDZ5744668.1 DUF3275 family protein [Pseudomonas asiatica]MDZ5748828.1 DUF3275 family protein [Pseudomonas asiatica]MDZ5753160.1 DUF3275 family protein [Pseudomonas asiatica]
MISITGQLAIRTISGRLGLFNVGRLSTSIGEFTIKDALLDQYQEGKYRGDFAIRQIRPSYYSHGGRLVVEIRAELEEMTLEDVTGLSREDEEHLPTNVPDPLEEDGAQTAPPQRRSPSAPPPQPPVSNSASDQPFGMDPPAPPIADDTDAELFGTVWPLNETVRLDTTVDRQRLRAQCTRLDQLGYTMDFKTQTWTRTSP